MCMYMYRVTIIGTYQCHKERSGQGECYTSEVDVDVDVDEDEGGETPAEVEELADVVEDVVG